MIQNAEISMLPYLKELWHEAFGDSEDYIELFFAHRFVPEQALVWAENGRPLSMLYLLPAHLNTESGNLGARYIYAIATKQEHKGKGISTALLQHASKLSLNDGELLFLVPSSEGLFEFYKKRGFKPFFYLREISLSCKGDMSEQAFEPVPPTEYKALRDHFLSAQGYLIWDEQAIAYAMLENAQLGGQTLAFSFGGERHAVMLIARDEVLYLRETTLPAEALLPALGAFAQELGCNTIRARLPALDCGTAKPFGMLYDDERVKETHGYLNLTLD